ncbi:1070_t:CDS:2 [Acaulospora morrowiae]|uniref:1070_t:CDS:1 n=1 Tax=Acaulospora morrowiae TaxID=94023 RepID=A0A9N9ANJ0_9GLOM|nr:1070_t:CDS:2 [Acaulospora morrowiae]
MHEKTITLDSTSVEEIKRLGTEKLIEFLCGQESLHLDADDCAILRNEKISGSDFFTLTKEEFMQDGLKRGPATRLVDFARRINKIQERNVEADGDTDAEEFDVISAEGVDKVEELTNGVKKMDFKDFDISEGCKNELKELLARMPVDGYGRPNLTLPFLCRMGYLKEGCTVSYEKIDATFHENPVRLHVDGTEYESIKKFVEMVNKPDSVGGNDYSKIIFDGVAWGEIRHNIGKLYKLMQIINKAIGEVK